MCDTQSRHGGQGVQNVSHGAKTDDKEAKLGLGLQTLIFSQGWAGPICERRAVVDDGECIWGGSGVGGVSGGSGVALRKQKQILHSAYPTYVGPASTLRSGLRLLGEAIVSARLKPRTFKTPQGDYGTSKAASATHPTQRVIGSRGRWGSRELVPLQATSN